MWRDERGFMSISNLLWALITLIFTFQLLPILTPYIDNATADLQASYPEAALLVRLTPFIFVYVVLQGIWKAGQPIIYTLRGRGGERDEEEDEFGF